MKPNQIQKNQAGNQKPGESRDEGLKRHGDPIVPHIAQRDKEAMSRGDPRGQASSQDPEEDFAGIATSQKEERGGM
ncbi:MAG TPA: hypothetical protein VG796_12125 [Verrucomicrobiales bacterium]|jgi:hypothetical protein|nr:hypothetical protein [Verrucomicrobiales bacterium]